MKKQFFTANGDIKKGDAVKLLADGVSVAPAESAAAKLRRQIAIYGTESLPMFAETSRAGKKNPEKEIEDLEKAAWYLKREIELLKAAKEGREPCRSNELAK